MTLDQQTMKERGCLICVHRTSKKKYAKGTKLNHYCEYNRCPYAELNGIKNYVRDTKQDTSDAESRANIIVKKMIREQGE